MKKNTDFANSERKTFIAKQHSRQLKRKYAPVIWPYYLASAVLAFCSLYLLYAAF